MMHVTWILSVAGLREWPSHMSAADRQWYCDRGKAIHKACELYDQDKLGIVDDRIRAYVDAYIQFRADTKWELVAIEQALESKNLGVCGTLDRVFKRRGKKIILDIKTSDADQATAVQTAGYAIMYGGKPDRMAIALRDDGTYRLHDYKDRAGDYSAFMGAVAVAGWKLRNRLIEPEGQRT